MSDSAFDDTPNEDVRSPDRIRISQILLQVGISLEGLKADAYARKKESKASGALTDFLCPATIPVSTIGG